MGSARVESAQESLISAEELELTHLTTGVKTCTRKRATPAVCGYLGRPSTPNTAPDRTGHGTQRRSLIARPVYHTVLSRFSGRNRERHDCRFTHFPDGRLLHVQRADHWQVAFIQHTFLIAPGA